jgi:hypothetical protein
MKFTMKVFTGLALLSGVALWTACGEKPAAKKSEAPATAKLPPRITQFYAYPDRVNPADSTRLCYGVENARAVRMEPAVEELKPSLSRCFDVTPGKTTEYTLVAEASDGTSVSQKVMVTVDKATARQPRTEPAIDTVPLLQSFRVDKAEIAVGEIVTLCYSTSGKAESLAITPNIVSFTLPQHGCFGHAPKESTTYKLTAIGENGKSESLAVSVKVR